MAADLLDYPQRDACIAHLGESRSPKTVGAGSLNADPVAGFSETARRRVAGDVPPVVGRVAAWE